MTHGWPARIPGANQKNHSPLPWREGARGRGNTNPRTPSRTFLDQCERNLRVPEWALARTPRRVGRIFAWTALSLALLAFSPLSATLVAAAPSAPTGLQAYPGDNHIILSWAANPEADIAGYNVYRSTTSGGGYTLLTPTPVATPDYDDQSVSNGTTYYYVVSAVDNSNTEGPTSAEVSVVPTTTGPTNVSGVISTDTTWTLAGSPYIVTGTVYVYKDSTTASTLTIEPGVEVRFNQYQRVEVGSSTNKGILQAQGTATAPIVFTSNQTTKTSGYYYGLRFQAGAGNTSILDYVTVEYGGYANSGNIYINGSSPTIKNSTLQQSSTYGVYVTGTAASPVLQSTTIKDNTGIGLYMNQGSPSLTSMSFSGTGGTYALSMPAATTVTTTGTHSFDKPIELRSGTVNVDTTWRNLGVAYVSSGLIRVYKDSTTASTLTIEPGVEVRFNQYQRLEIGYSTNKGTLNAQGTATAPILFTSNQTTKTPGYWYGLRFFAGSGNTSLLEYVTVEYGGYVNNGNIYINGSSPTIKNSTLQQSSTYGVYVTGAAASPVLQSTTIKDNTGIGLYMNQGSPSLTSMTFSGTGGDYAMSLPATLTVTTTGTHSFDKPIELRSGTVNVDTTWRNLGVAYVSSGLIRVYKDSTTASTLTIEPGVEIRFNQYQRLEVGSSTNKGTLKAQGTASAPILFTSNQTTKTPGYWYGLRFFAGSGNTSLLEYVTVEYGGYGNYGNIYINGSSPTIKNSTLQQSSTYGVYVTGTAASPVLQGTVITQNSGDGVYVSSGAALLTNVSVTNNGGRGIYFGSTADSLSLTGTAVTGNTGTYSMSLGAATPVTNGGGNSFDKPIELRAGTISVDTTWRNLGAAYVSSGLIRIYKDSTTASTLTIEPGVEVRFNQYQRLEVGSSTYKGTLNAQGTATSPIVFTSNQTTKTPGYWYGLRFFAGAGTSSLLEYVTVEYGGYASSGNIYINGSSPTIRLSTIRNSTYSGFHVSGTANPMIEKNLITGNTYGIYSSATGLSISQNDILGNTTYGAYHTNAASPMNATYNWWGSSSGPSGVGPGTGDAVSANVTFDPWLTESALGGGGTLTPPVGVAATAGNGSVDISWTPKTEGNIAGYHVYRRTEATAPVRLTTSLVTGSTYTDTTAQNGRLYLYSVTAVTTENEESDRSVEVSARPMACSSSTVTGNLTSDTTWTAACSPYLVTSSVTVYNTTAGATLTIEPGVEAWFQNNTKLTIGSGNYLGKLIAQGTASTPIRFTSESETPAPGDWYGLRFDSGSGNASILEYVTVEYGGYGNQGNIYVNGSSPLIKNSTLQQSSNYGIYVTGTSASPVLDSATIKDNSGIGLYVNQGSPSLTSMSFSGTGGTYAMSLPSTLTVTTTGTHSFDKPVELRAGAVNVDTTWKNLGVTYVSSGTIYVYKDSTTASTLTIEPGVEVRFNQYQIMFVGYSSNKGILKAQGTASAPILFTSNQTTKTQGYWRKIDFAPSTDSNTVLEYVTVEYGGYGNQGNLYLNGASPTIKNSTIRESSNYGVYVTGTAGAPVFESTTIKDNAGTGLYMASGSLSLTGMTFSGTGGTYAMSLPAATAVSASGTHSFDKSIELRGGTISVDTTWRNLGAPYVASGYIYVYKDTTTPATLTIEPGVEVRFNQYQTLEVGSSTNKGALKAQGTASAPILFTSNQTTKAQGYWRSLRFQASAESASLLEYVTVEYGGYGSQGNVYISGSSPTIKNSTIQHSSNYGVRVDGSAASPVLRANNFVGNATYGLYNATSNTLDARASWWNHASGPSGVGSGTGEKIYGDVLYTPWLETPQNPLYFASEAQVTRTLFNKNNDSTAFIANLSASGAWTLQVLDKDSTVVKTYTGTGSLVNQAWDGEQDGSTEKAPDGTYTLRLTATDSLSGEVMAPLVARVYVAGTDAPVAVIGSAADGAVLRGGDTISVTGTAADTNDFVSYRVEYGVGASPTTWYTITYPADITTPVVDGQLATWNANSLTGDTYTLRLTVKDASSPDSTAQATVSLMTILNPQVSPQYFSPNGDSLNDTTTFTATLTLSADWTVTIKDSGGTTVRTLTGSGTSVSQVWDGKDDLGAVVPEGDYTYTLEAVESTSGVAAAPKTGTVYVDLSIPVAEITAPTSGSTVFDTIQITGTASDPYLQQYKVEYGSGTSPTTWTLIKYSTAQVTDGTLATWVTNSFKDEILVPTGNGPYTIRLTVTDRAGQSATDQVTVTLDNMLISNVSLSNSMIQPIQGETTTITFTINQPAEATLRIVPEPSHFKAYPDQTPEADAVRTIGLGSLAAGIHTATWDGKDDAAQIVADDAYIYVIEVRAPSSRFDKFNQYVTPTTGVSPLWFTWPVGSTTYNPYKNEFVSNEFQLTFGAGRWSLKVYGVANGTNFTLFPQQNLVAEVGVLQKVFWDGRDDAGNILTGITSISLISEGANGSHHFTGIKTNYIITKGSTSGVPGISIKSDPYIIYLSYGQFTRIQYTLEQDANVTVTVKDPDTNQETVLVDNELQTAGDQEVLWDGTAGSTLLVPTEGYYTFTITATHPVTGASTVRRGNITVYK